MHLYHHGATITNTSMVVSLVVFDGNVNTASNGYGAGLFAWYGDEDSIITNGVVDVSEVDTRNNFAAGSGGGMYVGLTSGSTRTKYVLRDVDAMVTPALPVVFVVRVLYTAFVQHGLFVIGSTALSAG